MSRGKTHLTNIDIAALLREIAAVYEFSPSSNKMGNQFFKIRAYETAATAVEHATSDLQDIWEQGKLDDLPGVGASIAGYLDELFRTGEVQHFEELKKDLPKGMFPLLDIPGIGPKTAYKLAQELRIQSVEELRQAAESGKVQNLTGFGEKTEQEVLDGIAQLERKSERMLLPQAQQMADEVIAELESVAGVVSVDALGSLRRQVATIGDIDLAVAVEGGEYDGYDKYDRYTHLTIKSKRIMPRSLVGQGVSSKTKSKGVYVSAVLEKFTRLPKVKEVIERGTREASVQWFNGKRIDLRVQEVESYGALLQHYTGSKQHNIHLRKIAKERGLSLSEYGIKKGRALLGGSARLKNQDSKTKTTTQKLKLSKFKTEEEFYKFLGMDWIPPEIREDTGEIEAALKGKLPELITLRDIRGDLHAHCDFDLEESHDPGRSSMAEFARKGLELGYEYVSLGSHNSSVYNHTDQEIINLIKSKQEQIDQIQLEFPKIKLLNEIEVDILADGKLAIPDEGLELLDVVIVSIHSSMHQPKERMTRRIVQALQNPLTHILGHPTGRLLDHREGYGLDWEQVFATAKRHRKAIEINSFYNRLDLPDTLVREAVREGVKLVINTDAHAVEQMDLMRYGVGVARRGWATAGDVLNTKSRQDVTKYFAKE